MDFYTTFERDAIQAISNYYSIINTSEFFSLKFLHANYKTKSKMKSIPIFLNASINLGIYSPVSAG